MRSRNSALPVRALTPAAHPVDLYYRPQEQGVAKPDMGEADQLAELARSLSVVNDKLGGHFDKEKKRQDAEAGAKGARAALDNNKIGWNDYLDGLKKSDPTKYEQMQGANPWVQRGYEEQHMKNMGLDYVDQLDIDMASNPVVGTKPDGTELRLQDAEDPGVVSSFMQSHLQTYMKNKGLEGTDDIALVENFLPGTREAQHGWLRRNAAARQEAMVDKRLGAMATNSAAHLMKAFREGAFTYNSNAALADLGAALTANIREAYDGGVRDFDRLNEKTVEAVVAAAKLYKDDRFLQVLDHIETSPGNKLGDVPKHQLIAEQTRQHLKNLKEEDEKLGEWRREKQRKQLAENVMAPVVQRMLAAMKNPDVSIDDLDITGDVEKLTKAGLGAEAMTLMGWRTSLINQETNVKLNTPKYGEAQDRIQKGDMTTAEIVAGTGKFWSDDVTRSLIQNKQFYDRLKDEKEEGIYRAVDSVMDDDVKFIKEAIGGTADFSANTPKDVKNRALEAVSRYRADLQSVLQDFAEKNNGRFPKPHEVRTMAAKLRQEIINDPLYRSANSNDERFLSPTEQGQIKSQVPNARAGDFDVFRLPPDEVKRDLAKVPFLGSNEQSLRKFVEEYEATGRGLIAAMSGYLGVPAVEIIAKQAALHRLKSGAVVTVPGASKGGPQSDIPAPVQEALQQPASQPADVQPAVQRPAPRAAKGDVTADAVRTAEAGAGKSFPPDWNRLSKEEKRLWSQAYHSRISELEKAKLQAEKRDPVRLDLGVAVTTEWVNGKPVARITRTERQGE